MTIKFTLTFLLLILVNIGMSQPYGLKERIPNTTFHISTSGDTLASMELEEVYSSLSFNGPVHLTNAADGTDRIFVVEKAGIIKVFNNQSDISSSKVFLNGILNTSSFLL